MKYTSASANKKLRALEEEKEYVLGNEREVRTYTLSLDEEAEPPAYDYHAVRERIEEIDSEVRALRHALHAFNVVTVLPESGITIDEALVLMAQLNGEKRRLALMRSILPKRRVGADYYRANKVVEYEYANFDTAEAEADFQEVSERIRALQMEIDYVNQTETFEV